MSISFELNAEPRADLGKGASRRLRRQGKLPAVLYGAGKDPETLIFTQHELQRQLQNEAFYSHILQINIGPRKEQAVVRELQRHPFKPAIVHMDLLRVTADVEVRVHVPLHFINEDTAPGVKLQGGVVSRSRIEAEVSCLPRNLPEFIEVDLGDLHMGETISLSQLKLPAGVTLVELAHGEAADAPVVGIHGHKAAAEEEEAGGAAPPAEETGG